MTTRPEPDGEEPRGEPHAEWHGATTGEEIGEVAGGISGSVVGAGLGTLGGPLGVIVGGLAGAIAGWFTGRTVAGSVRQLGHDDVTDALFRSHYDAPGAGGLDTLATQRWDDVDPAGAPAGDEPRP